MRAPGRFLRPGQAINPRSIPLIPATAFHAVGEGTFPNLIPTVPDRDRWYQLA